jgi:hypothetical protein
LVIALPERGRLGNHLEIGAGIGVAKDGRRLGQGVLDAHLAIGQTGKRVGKRASSVLMAGADGRMENENMCHTVILDSIKLPIARATAAIRSSFSIHERGPVVVFLDYWCALAK